MNDVQIKREQSGNEEAEAYPMMDFRFGRGSRFAESIDEVATKVVLGETGGRVRDKQNSSQ